MSLVYLAGPIHERTDHEATAWRDRVAAVLGADRIIDPMRHDYRGSDVDPAEIVETDLADIERASVVLAHCWTPSAGTAMEIRHAFTVGREVVVVAHEPVSPWLTYHASAVYPTLRQAVCYVAGIGR